jgi:hypothetical protein
MSFLRHCDPDVLCREKQSLALIYNQLLLREKYFLPAACLPPACRLPAGKGRAKAGQKQARNIKFIIILLYHKFFITLGIFADNHLLLLFPMSFALPCQRRTSWLNCKICAGNH